MIPTIPTAPTSSSVVVLASASPTRAQLLQAAGVKTVLAPAHVDEDAVKGALRAEGVDATDAAVALAEMKALRVAPRYPGALVIGADQILVCDGEWFDKPADMDHAKNRLRALRGKTHGLATAAVVVRDGKRIWHHVDTPKLTMRSFSDSFIEDYLAHEGADALASVGAYRLEGMGVQLFARIDGDFFTILGLPLLALLGFLREHGAVPS
ncbi:MAG: septum formation protein Maf [Alphaproteobacteria bacterium]|nr:septum formation protein Maf [Alphaproteobacteria bacterium]